MTRTQFKVVASGVAKVYCLHDREKRQITTEADVAELGRAVGQVYDPAQHKLHNCACCQNLFVDVSDTPRLCSVCLGSTVHTAAAPIPSPTGVVE